MIITCLSLILMASPLFRLGEIIRKKDSSALPLPLIAMGTIVSFLWLVYGLAARNHFLIAQNTAGFVICLLQIPLLVIYPNNHQTRKEKDL
ncbi:sugar transporter SWEET1-like [Ctenocephalides felis]|nr:sugar transporter SWEET1-like [Ctenocephalides felis]